MRNRLTLSSFLFILGILSSGNAFSQDDRIPDLDNSVNNNSELLLEGELKITKPVQVTSDSTGVKPALKKADKGKSDENKSVLSFNFLYYLIERYKLADIVD